MMSVIVYGDLSDEEESNEDNSGANEGTKSLLSSPKHSHGGVFQQTTYLCTETEVTSDMLLSS
jgi:hypothetical protein